MEPASNQFVRWFVIMQHLKPTVMVILNNSCNPGRGTFPTYHLEVEFTPLYSRGYKTLLRISIIASYHSETMC